MAEKQIKTRIKLLTRTLADWNGDHKDDILLAGEIGICEIPSGKAPTAGSVDAPTVLFKVGDGSHKFHELNWASALAADVYSWGKLTGDKVFAKDGTGNVVSGITYDATLNDGKGGFKYTTASVATSEGLEELQETVAGIAKDIADNRDGWAKDDNDNTTYQFSIPDSGDDKGKLLVQKKEIGDTDWAKVGAYDFVTPDELTTILADYKVKTVELMEGTTNGTLRLRVNGEDPTKLTDVAVHGLGSAAFTESTAYDASGAATTAKNEAIADAATKYVTNVEIEPGTTNGTIKYHVQIGTSQPTHSGDIAITGLGSAAFTDSTAYDASGAADGVKTYVDTNFYTKTDADAAFATPAEVITEVNKALADVSNTDTITNITTLVTYVNENAGDLATLIGEVYGSADMTGDSRIDTAIADSSTAKSNAATAVSDASEAKSNAATALSNAATALSTANDAKSAAITAQNSASASAQAAAGSASAANSSAEAAAQSVIDAGTAKTGAESARDAAVSAKSAAETAQGKAEEAQAAAEAAQSGAVAAKEAAEASNTSATAIANAAKSAADAATAASNAATQAVAGLHTIATSGSIYDVVEASKTEDDVVYLLLDCNW